MGLAPFPAMRLSDIRRRIGTNSWDSSSNSKNWWLTRKPDDPMFQLVADFTATIFDIRRRTAAFGLNESYAR